MQAALPELDRFDGVVLTHHYITISADVTLHVDEVRNSGNATAENDSAAFCLFARLAATAAASSCAGRILDHLP